MTKEMKNYATNVECWLNVSKAFLKCQRVMNRLLADLDITIAQHEILVNIQRNEGMTLKALAEELLVVKSNVSNLVMKLQSRQLIRVTACTSDLRAKRLSLTAAGRELVKKSAAIQKSVIESMVENISPAEITATNQVMLKALDSLP